MILICCMDMEVCRKMKKYLYIHRKYDNIHGDGAVS